MRRQRLRFEQPRAWLSSARLPPWCYAVVEPEPHAVFDHPEPHDPSHEETLNRSESRRNPSRSGGIQRGHQRGQTLRWDIFALEPVRSDDSAGIDPAPNSSRRIPARGTACQPSLAPIWEDFQRLPDSPRRQSLTCRRRAQSIALLSLQSVLVWGRGALAFALARSCEPSVTFGAADALYRIPHHYEQPRPVSR
jgi:hypothetical protein